MQTFETQALRDRILGGAIHGGPAVIYHVAAALRPSLESYLKVPWPDTWSPTAGLVPTRSTQFATAAIREVVQGDTGSAIPYIVLCASIAAVGGAAMVNGRIRRPIPPPNPPPSKDSPPPSPDPSRGGPDDELNNDHRGRPDNPEDPPPPPPPPPPLPAVDPDPGLGAHKGLLFLLLCVALSIRRKGVEDIASTLAQMPALAPATSLAASIPPFISDPPSTIINHTVYGPTKIGVSPVLTSRLDRILLAVFFLVLVKHSARAFRLVDKNQDNDRDNANEDPLVEQSTRTFNTLALAAITPLDDHQFLADPPDQPVIGVVGHSPPTPDHPFEVYEGESAEEEAIADHAEDISIVEADYDPGAHSDQAYNAYSLDDDYDPHPGGDWYMDSDASDSPHTPVPRSVLGDEIELDSTTDVNTSHISPLGPSTSSPVLDTEFTDTLPLSDSDIDGPSDAASAGSFADIEDNNDDDNISHLEYYSRISASFQDRYTMQLPRERLDTGISGSADTLGLRIPEVAEVDAFADEETSDDEYEYENENENENENPQNDDDPLPSSFDTAEIGENHENDDISDDDPATYGESLPYTNYPEEFGIRTDAAIDRYDLESGRDPPTSPETQYDSSVYDTSEWDPSNSILYSSDEYRIELEEGPGATGDFDILHEDEVVWHFIPEDFDALAPTVDIIIEDSGDLDDTRVDIGSKSDIEITVNDEIIPTSVPLEDLSTVGVGVADNSDANTEWTTISPSPSILDHLEAEDNRGIPPVAFGPNIESPAHEPVEPGQTTHPQEGRLDFSHVWAPFRPPLHLEFDVPIRSLPEADIGEQSPRGRVRDESRRFDYPVQREAVRPPPPLEQDLTDTEPPLLDPERRMHVGYSIWNVDE